VLKTEEVMRQFDGIREEEQHNRSTFIEANQPYNRGKNRYMNVKAIDSSRVKLSGGSNPGDDYINANFVDGWRRPGAYIATQGPVPESFPHFWQMIWEQNCSTIVMVTKEIEMGRLKCHQYWPNAQDAMDAGAFQVISDVEDRSDPTVLLRKFKLKKNATGEVRDVSHLQMLSWPDQNTPETPRDFLDYLNKVRGLQGEGDAKGQTGPAVVHCSAGIGRSGTYMMLDTALKRMDQIGNVDACASVKHMRSQRHGSVQTLAQYRFIYEAIDFYAQNVASSARSGTSLATGPLSASEKAAIKALADQSSGVTADRLMRQIQALR
jgi:protein tyrosine phosphatase